MITTTTAYGIPLTDEYGRFYKSFELFSVIKPNKFYSEDEGDYLFPHLNMQELCSFCPSANNTQFVLGIDVHITKSMDIVAIHNQWLNYMENLPVEFKEFIEDIKQNSPESLDPDFQIMAGKI